MIIKIRDYKDRDYERLKKISKDSFELTSFNLDRTFSRRDKEAVIWDLWAKPALKKKGFKPCIVAIFNNRIAGFLIYGYNAKLSRALKLKFGSIILLAIAKRFQGKYGIGGLLINRACGIFMKNGINYVGVGTDLANISAIALYQKYNFRLISPWATFKFYSDKDYEPFPVKRKIIFAKKQDFYSTIFDMDRPNAIIDDRRIDTVTKKRLIEYLKKNLIKQAEKDKVKIIRFANSGWASFQRDDVISGTTGSNYYRINDIVAKGDAIFRDLLNFVLNKIYDSCSGKKVTIEYFLRLSDCQYSKSKLVGYMKKIDLLIEYKFLPVHFAVSLLKKIQL